MEFPPAAGVLRTSSATVGIAPQGRLVTKRSVPSLASKARPACEEPPRNWPQERGTVETHCESPNCGAFPLPAAGGGTGTVDAFGAIAGCGFPALSATVAHPRIARAVAVAFQNRFLMLAPPKLEMQCNPGRANTASPHIEAWQRLAWRQIRQAGAPAIFAAPAMAHGSAPLASSARFGVGSQQGAEFHCEISSRARPRVRGPKMAMAKITTAMAAAMNVKTPRVP